MDTSKILAFIATSDDPEKLKVVIENAKKQGESSVEQAAFRRLISIVPSEKPGTVEHDFWQTIHAFEYMLTVERGKTTRLARTRQKIARVGVISTLRDWALSTKPTDGFDMLIDRGCADLTGEAIVLRHPGSFSPEVAAAARRRLSQAAVSV